MKLHFGYLLGLGALAIAGCAAFFSVYGISQLFAGATLAVIVMASTLEFGKLIAASYLQRYWTKIAVAMRIYVVIGVVILVGITSAGIYGFLSNAYQKTADSLNINQTKIANIDLKKGRYEEELAEYTTERAQLSTTINELSKGLANNVIQYKDKETGQLITTTSSSTRRVLTEQLNDAKGQRDKISPKMSVIRDSITSMDLQVLDLKVNDEASAELGPLKYLAELTGLSMDRVVNYFILLLIFVFDPLAIALVLATNWVFEQERIKREGLKIKPLDLTLDKNTKQHIDNLAEIDKFTKKEMRKTVGIPPKYFGYEDVLKEMEIEDPIPKYRRSSTEVEGEEPTFVSPGTDVYPPNEYKQYKLITEDEFFKKDDAVNDDDIQQPSEILMEDLMKEEPVVVEEVYDEDAEGLPPVYDKKVGPETEKEIKSFFSDIVTDEDVDQGGVWTDVTQENLENIEVLKEELIDVLEVPNEKIKEKVKQIESPSVPVVEGINNHPRPIIPQTERPVAKNGIVKPPSNVGATKTKPTVVSGKIELEDIKEIREGASRKFSKKIPRRGNR